MIVVGLTGDAGVGKDTVADYLVNRWGYEKRSFAAPLKEILLQQDPIIGFHIYRPQTQIHLSEALKLYGEDAVKKLYPLYRRYLQRLGTEGIREIDPDFWIKAASKSLTNQSGKYVFTDVRFPNEAEFIGDCRGSLWQIEGPRRRDGAPAHSSEDWAGKLGEAFLVMNTGSMDRLYTEIDYVLGLMNWKYTVRAA